MRRALAYVALPAEVTRSEVAHLERTNRLAWPVLATAIPLVAALAWRQHTGVLVATELTAALAAATFFAGRALSRPRLVSVVNGAAAMGLAALVVRFGPAALTGELHGAFYVLLATLVVSCNPVVIQFWQKPLVKLQMNDIWKRLHDHLDWLNFLCSGLLN